MDQTIRESLQQWTLLAQQKDVETRDHLRAILHYAMELSRNSDYAAMEEVRYRLERTLVKEEPSDLTSYYLGIARGMADWMSICSHAGKSEEITSALPELEEQLLRCVANHPRITPSEIRERLHIENKQHISNVLSKLRAKELVSYWQVGKNRWYTVTEFGKRVLASLRTREEQSAAVHAAPTHRNDSLRPRNKAEDVAASWDKAYSVVLVSEPALQYFQYMDFFENEGRETRGFNDKTELTAIAEDLELDEEEYEKVLA